MFYFTYRERRWLLFLAGLLCIGSIVRYFQANKAISRPDNVSDYQKKINKININYATSSDLEGIPGIGPKLAYAIIEYRTKQAFFYGRNDLAKIKGVGAKKAHELEGYFFFSVGDR